MWKECLVFLPRYSRNGASSRYRQYQVASAIGVDVNSIFPFFAKNRSLVNFIGSLIERLRVLLMHKDSVFFVEADFFPYFPFNIWIPKRYILDFDDPIWYNEKFGMFLAKAKYRRLVQNSSHIICGSFMLRKYIIEELGALEKNISWIPTTVASNHYHDDVRRGCLDVSPNQINLVWIGSPYTSFMVDSIYNSDWEDICWHLVGYRGKLEEEKNVFIYEWSRLVEQLVANSDVIGISPMTGLSRHEIFKCGFKTVQYLAMGLPVVASKLAPNVQILGDYEYYSKEDNWYDVIKSAWDAREVMAASSWRKFGDLCLEQQLTIYNRIFELVCVE